MPRGKVKWYDPEKGFGFITQDEGEDVYVRASVLPDDVTELKPGQRVDMDIAAGRRGPQALRLEILAPAPSVSANQRKQRRQTAHRHTPDELHGMIEDMITLMESTVQPELRKGRYPDRKTAQHISEIVRAVARELDR